MGVEEILALAGFLGEHADLLKLAYDALEGGVTKAELMASIRASMVAASDAAVKAELGL